MKIAIVIKNGIIQQVFTDSETNVEIELLNLDDSFSLKEKNDKEQRIRELSENTNEFFEVSTV